MAGDIQEARARFEAVVRADPDSMEAAIALDSLRELAGRRLLAAPPTSCPEAATQAYSDAERRWYAGNAAGAVQDYERAVAGCPENAFYWIHSGDAHFKLGDYQRASELYREGLQRQPWERSAHRFMADAEMNLGHLDNARRAAILAVVSDPTYEAGWATLRVMTLSMGGFSKRVRGHKPEVGFDADGRPTITIRNPPGSDSQGDTTAWMAYALIEFQQKSHDRGVPVGPDTLASESEPPPASPVDRELRRADEAIEIHGRFVTEHPGQVSRFWQMMTEAKERGFLKEAVFVHLLDEDLVEDYVRLRDSDPRRLVEYIERLLAPLPAEPASPRAL